MKIVFLASIFLLPIAVGAQTAASSSSTSLSQVNSGQATSSSDTLATSAATSTPKVNRDSWRRQRRNYEGESATPEAEEARVRSIRQSSPSQSAIQALSAARVDFFPIPVLLGLEVSDLFANFGDPRGTDRTHEGLDIMAVKGTPIVSPTDAVVLRTGMGTNSGVNVYTANPGGETFAYMHLDRIATGVTSGTVLKRGDLIGYVGNTGNASGGPAHLHFETRKDGAQDPLPRLNQAFSLEDRITAINRLFTSGVEPGFAEFLVKEFKPTFVEARSRGLVLPASIVTLLEASPTLPNTSIFTRDLFRGVVGEDVRALQQLLNGRNFTVAVSGAGSVGQETNFFGPATKAALIKFQAANNINPAAGYFGPITRAFVVR